MAQVEIYTKNWCSFCKAAKLLLDTKGIEYLEHDVTTDPDLVQEMVTRSQRRSVPQIFIDQDHVGGYDELVKLQTSGKLCQRLNMNC